MRKSNYGFHAETFVCDYLETQGYQIMKRNYRADGGEADIIAALGGYICFVEIKFRTNGSSLETAIDRKKQKRIIKSAEQFMRKTGCGLQPRFDAAFVSSYNGEDMSLEYILNAFDASGVL